MRRSKLIKAVGLLAATLGLALPASASAQAFQHRQPAAHAFAHTYELRHGRGRLLDTAHAFLISNAADIHWWLEWRCPHGQYGMHVDLDVHGYSSDAHRGYAWQYFSKIYGFGPPNPHHGAVGAHGVEHVRRNDTWKFRFSFHAADACEYGFIAGWH